MRGKDAFALIAGLLAACGRVEDIHPDASSLPQDVRVQITPEEVTVPTGSSERFDAVVTGASDRSVAWSIIEGALGGSISSDGIYVAPALPGEFHVVAVSNADHNSSAQALVVVTHPSVVSVSVSPQSVTVAPGSTTRFTADVTGTNVTGVVWSAEAGAIDQVGTWTAPPRSGIFHITAQSVADPTKTAFATGTVSAAEVTISIEPDHVVLTAGGPGFQFKAHVTGSPDTTVTWSIEEPPGGSSIDAAGVFKPPLGESVYHVIATSHSDPTKTASAVVNVVEDLIDHGGPVFPVSRTFALWWGDATAFAPDSRTVLENMLRGLDGSAYLAIADQYMRGARATTSFAGNLFDSSAPPDEPTATSVPDAACRALDAYRITPRDGDLVLVITSNFPSGNHSYCGWHSWSTCHGQAILLAYIPNAAGSMCESTNDVCNSGFAMPTISLLITAAHEVMEAITDPFASAWFGSSFPWDLADRCGYLVCVPLSTGTFELGNLYSNATHTCVPQ